MAREYNTEMEVTFVPNEAFARALRRYCEDNNTSINPDYVLGRGVSAKVYGLSETEVLLLTYVRSKVAVARTLGIAHEVLTYDVGYRNRYDIQDTPIYAIRMKRLLPLHCGTKDHEYQYAVAERIVANAIRRAGNWRDAWDIVRHASDADNQLRLLAHLAYISPSTPGGDMHGGNAMIDPDTGDLIYTDILHYYAETAATPMIEEIPTVEDLPEPTDNISLVTCCYCGELVDPEVAEEIHNQFASSGYWCADCVADNLAQINTGTHDELWAGIEEVHVTGSKVFWRFDLRLTRDDIGDTGLREQLIEVNGLLLHPRNICKDIFGNVHDKRNWRISWDHCTDCGAVIPLNTDGRMHEAQHYNLRMFSQFFDQELIAADVRNNWTFGKPSIVHQACGIGR